MIDFKSPKDLPPPPLLKLAVPLSEHDVHSGEVASMLTELARYPGFRDLELARLKESLAVAMGYKSWESMLNRDGPLPTSVSQLPRTEMNITDIMAWRMYIAGYAKLPDALVAVTGAFLASRLSVRAHFSCFGSRQEVAGETSEPYTRCVQLNLPGLHPDLHQWPEKQLMANGKLRIKCRATAAAQVAEYCWTDSCGISEDALSKDILDGSEVTIEDAIEQSWFVPAWPTGLDPVQYLDSTGRIFGYGWFWAEIGCLHGRVFETTAALKQSAVALWTGVDTAPSSRSDLPATLTMVEFENPWDRRLKDEFLAQDIKLCVAIEGHDGEGPWLDVVRTTSGRLDRGYTSDIAGEPWTRQAYSLRLDTMAMPLGLVLPGMEDVRSNEAHIPWLEEKVPFAIDLGTYESFCRLFYAMDLLNELEESLLDDPHEASKICALLRESSRVATPVTARSSEVQMAGTMGVVAACDVPAAGNDLLSIYPEMDALETNRRGEYALAYFGKNGIRLDRTHRVRDLMFMRYCILRNLGLDPATQQGTLVAVFSLVRDWITRHPDVWRTDEHRLRLIAEARELEAALAAADNAVESLNTSLSDSRLELLGLRRAEEATWGA